MNYYRFRNSLIKRVSAPVCSRRLSEDPGAARDSVARQFRPRLAVARE